MADLNTCTFTGRLTKDAISNTTPSGKQVVKFDLANNIGFGDYAKVLFVQVVIWSKVGQTLLPYLQKGKLVGVTGELSIDKWTSRQDGSEQQRLVLTAQSVILISGGPKKEDDAYTDAEVSTNTDYSEITY